MTDSIGKGRTAVPREKQLKVDGRVLNYAEWPGTGTPLVLIHGVVGYWKNWISVAPGFQAHYQVFALDTRGHGGSSHTNGLYDIDEYAGDVIEFLERSVKRPALLVGLSLGGLVALRASAKRPEMVKAVVMADPSFCYADDYGDKPFKHWFEETRRLSALKLSEQAILPIVAKSFPEFSATEQAEVSRCLALIDPSVIEAALKGRYFTRKTSEPLLKAAKGPVLIIQADSASGGGLPDEEAQWAVGLLKNGTLVKWAGSGHTVHRDPARLVQTARDFFERSA